MSTRDWFEQIRVWVVEANKLEGEIEEVETRSGPHGQIAGSIGGGSSHDSMGGIDRLVDSGMRERLERMRMRINPEIGLALKVLYGRSGRGGLAKARSSVDADILCCYYLQGIGWPQVAAQLSDPDTEHPNTWCRMRAKRALEYVDRVGASALAES